MSTWEATVWPWLVKVNDHMSLRQYWLLPSSGIWKGSCCELAPEWFAAAVGKARPSVGATSRLQEDLCTADKV